MPIWFFVTKDRHKVFGSAYLARMQEIMRDVGADFGAELAECNGEPGHVHLLVNFPPAVAISRLVNCLNGVSSRRLRQEYPDLRQHYCGPDACGPGHTSPDRPAGHLSPSCASTSNSKTRRP